MCEQEILDDWAPKWKGKYTVTWCNLCDVAIIICPEVGCHGTSCNGGGCEKCLPDELEFRKLNRHVEDYLTGEEAAAWRKGERLKEFILESLRRGEVKIDFNKLDAAGELSGRDKALFLPDN